MPQVDTNTEGVAVARTQEDLNQFVAAVAHDLLEPLATITGYLDLCLGRFGPDLPDLPRELIQSARHGAEGMQSLVEGLLDFATLSTRPAEPAAVDLAALVGGVGLRLGRAVDEAGGSLTIEVLPTVTGDAVALARLFQNLIANALKFRSADRPPTVSVRAMNSGDFWEFVVSDNGIGIPTDQLESVFGTFKRLHPRSRFAGSGLGLSICKAIVEAHHGSIWATSSEATGGTEFHFTLPRSTESEPSGADLP